MYAILFSVLAAAAAFAQPYQPESLHALGARVARESLRGANPVVVFDLDDTLINSRTRTVRILNEFSEQQAVPELEHLEVAQIRYDLEDTFKELGLADDKLLALANVFWKTRFFTNEYAAKDRPVPGAAAYVRWLAGQGARIVYLTGRGENEMREGTLANLERNHFPLDDDTVVLLMKPDMKMDDTVFKVAAFARINKMGEVVGAFENEPRNINAMQTAWPDALAIYLDTIHSKKPDVPAPGVFWVRDFRAD